jgi:seryl-tRNA synthetase
MKQTLSLPKPLHSDLIPDVQSKLAYIHEGLKSATVAGDGASIHYEVADPSIDALIRERLLSVTAQMSRGFRPRRAQVSRERCYHGPVMPHACDATAALLAESALQEELRGVYQFGPLPAALLRFVEDELLQISLEMGARPHHFPSLISPAILQRAGYFKAFPHSLSLVSPVRSDLEMIERFSAGAQADFSALPVETLSPPKAVLSPAVCFHLYDLLRQRRLDAPYVGYALGKCFRYESGNLSGLERLWDFSMFEIMTVGAQEDVLKRRKVCEGALDRLLSVMQIDHLVTVATDPFFVGEYAVQTSFQSAFELKYEIRALLPKTEKTLAIGSFNYHQDHFGKAFEIASAAGGPAHTGCSAFGLERWVCAFIAQHGPQPRFWPEEVRRGVERYGGMRR